MIQKLVSGKSICRGMCVALVMLGAAVPGGAQQVRGSVGAVYVMTNQTDQNAVVAFARTRDGLLHKVGTYPTGGRGAVLDGGEGLDPLVSAYSLYKTANNKFLVGVNAGSQSVSVFEIQSDRSLVLSAESVPTGYGNPVSAAVTRNRVYVGHTGGAIVGFTIDGDGGLERIDGGEDGALRVLPGRLSSLFASPDGKYLAAGVLNTGKPDVGSAVYVYPIERDGKLGAGVGATSTGGLDGDTSSDSSELAGYSRTQNPGRNFPTTIGLAVTRSAQGAVVIATEAREIQSDGDDPVGVFLQPSSVTTYLIGTAADGQLTLTPIPGSVDILTASDDDFHRTACWVAVAPNRKYFWTANAVDASISAFRFDAGSGQAVLENAAAADNNAVFPSANTTVPRGVSTSAAAFSQTDGFIDMFLSKDGKYLYQLYGLTGEIGIYAVDKGTLTLVERISDEDIPKRDIQGIVAF